MTRALLLATTAILLGIGTAEYLIGNISFRRWLGHVVRRGELVALVERRGVYESDLRRAGEAHRFAGAPVNDQDELRRELIAEAKVSVAARKEQISARALNHEMDLLHWQFRDEKTWAATLRNAATSPWGLRRAVSENLRDRTWLERRIGSQVQPNETECRQYFTAHAPEFQAPMRLRASQLFLAAPDGYPAEVIAAKRSLIELVSKRLVNGESFPALVEEFSEDEASKKRDGDLGYFAEKRILPAVWEAAMKLRPGEISRPVRSRLGFHILRLTESLPPRALTFEEARPEIEMALANRQRPAAEASLLASLGTEK